MRTTPTRSARMARPRRPVPRVLLVDDDRGIRDLIALALEGEGVQVQAAPSGATALTLLERAGPTPFALILLDLHLPDMDGRQFVACYHRRPGPHAPVLLVTAVQADEAATSAEQLGAIGFLCKPFELDDLLHAVRRGTRPVEPGARRKSPP